MRDVILKREKGVYFSKISVSYEVRKAVEMFPV